LLSQLFKLSYFDKIISAQQENLTSCYFNLVFNDINVSQLSILFLMLYIILILVSRLCIFNVFYGNLLK